MFRNGNGHKYHHVCLARSFAEILNAPECPPVIAVDMPIGLPDRIDGPGRPAEQAVRPLLGQRQSSVFSIPSPRGGDGKGLSGRLFQVAGILRSPKKDFEAELQHIPEKFARSTH